MKYFKLFIEMDFENIVGKRKRQLKECPNPLFVHWLGEWAEDAAAKGMKSQYTYRKVLRLLLSLTVHTVLHLCNCVTNKSVFIPK